MPQVDPDGRERGPLLGRVVQHGAHEAAVLLGGVLDKHVPTARHRKASYVVEKLGGADKPDDTPADKPDAQSD